MHVNVTHTIANPQRVSAWLCIPYPGARTGMCDDWNFAAHTGCFTAKCITAIVSRGESIIYYDIV